MYSYDSYLKCEHTITFEEAAEMFKEMTRGIDDRRRIGDYACMCCAIITINMR